MAITYVQIGSTVTVGSGGAATITFTSILQTFTDLKVVMSTRTDGTNGNLRNTMAGITSGVYSERALYGDGSSVAVFSNTSQAFSATIYTDGSSHTASVFASSEWYIPNYTTANNKTFSTESVVETNASAAQFAVLGAGIMANTSAVTSITIASISADTFVQFTTASLYGIKSS